MAYFARLLKSICVSEFNVRAVLTQCKGRFGILFYNVGMFDKTAKVQNRQNAT